MRSREEQKKRSDAKCRHFNGMQNGRCESKVEYPSDVDVCFGMGGEIDCGGYNPLNTEELAAKEAKTQRHMDLMRRGLSSCCESPFDTRHVTTSGQFKGHGPRYCSKCKKLLFMV